MIFVAQQLVEKSREHETLLFVLFVDLKKAYESVPRCTLWQVLEKCGVPPITLSVIKYLHDGMKAAVRVEGGTTDNILVTNGLRQCCTLAPSFFNLYFSAMVTIVYLQKIRQDKNNYSGLPKQLEVKFKHSYRNAKVPNN